ncbi:hypothetical protein Q7P37_004569 [Cladosporium fusiforme]
MRISVAAITLAVLPQGAFSVDPLVHLNYSSYAGTANSNGITQWLGLRYAAPPVGSLRFAAPEDPSPSTHGIINADTHGPTCLATGREGASSNPPTNETNEDCLYLDVYAPSNATSWSNLPVMFFIQGGGFNSNSNANWNASGLLLASELNIVLVSFNYRVGPYGFLASKEILQGGSTNNGLKDQRQALKWVQRYISHFGGNHAHVVLSGASAGAASINFLLTAYGGRDDKLFHGAAVESQSFATVRTVDESQYQYENLVIRTGCASNASESTLQCLRNLNATALQEANVNTPFPGAQNAPLFMYGPVLDGDLVRQTTYAAYAAGNFIKVPAIYGSTSNEGSMYAHKNTSSYAESNTFLKDQFPAITPTQLGHINTLYPVEDTPTFPDSGRFWRQSANAYGELRYNCPGLFINSVYARFGLPAWSYHWDVRDPEAEAEGFGVRHVAEISAIWGPKNIKGSPPPSYLPGGVNNAVVPVIQGYWTSFVRSLDPNVYRSAGSPVWERWTQQSEGLLRFRTNATEVVSVPEDQRERCAYLSSIGSELRQ